MEQNMDFMENRIDCFQLLMEEKDRITMGSLFGQKPDFTHLRELCVQFEDLHSTGIIDVDGTDDELWSSVLEYFRGLK